MFGLKPADSAPVARRGARPLGLLLAAACLLVLTAAQARAATVAQGTMQVSADTAGNPLAFSTLTVLPIISEAAPMEFPNATIIIAAPTGFAFNPLQAVTAQVLAGDIMLDTPVVGVSTIQVPVLAQSTMASSIRFSDIQLRATTCAAAVAGEAADITVQIATVAFGGGNPGDSAPLVDVDVTPGALDHFGVTAVPATAAVNAAVTVTLRAEDACNNPIPLFQPTLPINIATIPAAAGNLTFVDGAVGSVVVTDTGNTAVINPVAGETFNSLGLADFIVTDDAGEGPLSISATHGIATGSAAARWIAATCTLLPAADVNPVGTQHTVTATVFANGAPEPAVTVNFAVTAGPNTGTNGSLLTDVNGQASFTYTSNGMAGTDTIQASGTIGTVPFMCTATKQWVWPQCTIAAMAPSLAGGNQTVNVTVEASAGVPAANGTVVNFAVIGGPNVGTVGMAAVAGGLGQAAFMYTSNGTPGIDTVRAFGVIGGAPFECLATKEWIQPSCTLAPATDVNAVGSMHSVTVTLLRRPGVPAVGVPVTFDVTAGPNVALDPEMHTTDALGQATYSYTSSIAAGAGIDTITATATVDGVAVTPCTATNELLAPADSCMLSPATDTNLAGTTHTVTATILRTTVPAATPAAGVVVNFQVTAGPNSGQMAAAVTDANGNASFTYMSNGMAGIDTIQATTTVEGVPYLCTATKRWITLSCALAPANATRPVGSMQTITMTVTSSEAIADGTPVTFQVVSGPDAAAPVAGALAANQATFNVTNNGTPGTDVLQGTITFMGVTSMCTTNLTFEVNPSCSIAPMAASLAATGAPQTVNVTVLAGSTPIVPAPNGTVVNFDVIAGPNVGASGMATVAGGAGLAAFTYNSNGQAGVDTVRASGTVSGAPFECLATKEWIQPMCSLTPPTDVNHVLPPPAMHTVTIALLRRPGIPAAGENVTFNITSGPNGGLFANQVTDAAGLASFTYTSNGNPGIDTITATASVTGVPAPPCTATKEWINGSCTLAPATDTNQIGTSHTVTASVIRTTFPAPSPAANVVVNFSVISGPNAGQIGAAVTDSAGNGSFTYTSNGSAGTDTIQAVTTVDGINFTCTATKTWIDAGCAIAPATDTNQVGTSHTVTTTVTSNGVPVNGVTVTFSVTAGPNTGQTAGAVTGAFPNNAGEATFTYTSNGTPGTDTITASGNVQGVPFACTATKVWIASGCTLTPAMETNQVNTQHTATATITRNGAPEAGVNVHFDITAGPNAGLVADRVTNASGQATFTYTGSGGVGTDTITLTGNVQGVSFTCTATKTWQADDSDNQDPSVEDGAPNNGDGNNDGIPDSLQPNVASLPDIFGNYVTFAVPAGLTLEHVQAINVPEPRVSPPDVLFPRGFFSFEVHGLAPGGDAVVTIFLHGGPTVNSWYKFGPTPILPVPRFYSFLFDGTLGAEINGNVIVLHLTDGARGDNDLLANGIIVEPGAPALESNNPAPPAPAQTCGLCGAGLAAFMPVMLLACRSMAPGRLRRAPRRIG